MSKAAIFGLYFVCFGKIKKTNSIFFIGNFIEPPFSEVGLIRLLNYIFVGIDLDWFTFG